MCFGYKTSSEKRLRMLKLCEGSTCMLRNIQQEEWLTRMCRGTGASVIYPLLACRLEPTWQFIGTGTFPLMHKELNYWRSSAWIRCGQGLISLRPRERGAQWSFKQSEDNGGITKGIHVMAYGGGYIINVRDFIGCIWFSGEWTSNRYEFVMCNPPFYSNPEEVAQSAEAKEFIPNAVLNLSLRTLIFSVSFVRLVQGLGQRWLHRVERWPSCRACFARAFSTSLAAGR